MVLVILAGGLGSRYGGAKQFDGLGPNGEWLLEYNLYDALLEGFTELVVITQPEARTAIESHLKERLPAAIQLTCVGQSLTDVPFKVPEGRTKPWGTAHAVWCAREAIQAPFVTLNADDLYGRAALRDAAYVLNAIKRNSNDFGIITYQLKQTLSPHGGVSRGVCEVDRDRLKKVVEYKSIRSKAGRIVDQVTGSAFAADAPVSMNCWVLQPSIMNSIEQALMHSAGALRNATSELFLPDVIQQEVDAGKIRVWNRPTPSTWAGLTYPKDRPTMKERLAGLIADGTYPKRMQASIPETVLKAFNISSGSIALPISAGLINQTVKVSAPEGVFIVQQLNTDIFQAPEKLLHNIRLVHAALCSDRKYTVPELRKTSSGSDLFEDEQGAMWRVMQFIPNSITYSSTESLPVAEEAGRAIGRFHRLTANVAVDDLYETLPNFHQVEGRLRQLASAGKHASQEKLAAVTKEMQFFRRYMKRMMALDLISVPVRVTHNDTKLNNILFDRESERALCLVDLDTLMPGKLHHDVADAVRTLCNMVSENESDTSKVKFHVPLFLAFCEGYFEQVGEILSTPEREILPESMLLMPYLMGVRFLTDFLNDDVYYHTAYPEQNLHRARNQMALFSEIKKWHPVISEIINERTGLS